MDNIRISLTVALPGSVMVTQAQAKEQKNLYNVEEISLTSIGKNGKKKTETLNILTRKCIPAKQAINMSEDALEHFKKSPISGYKTKEWLRLSVRQRVKLHCEEHAAYLGGKLIDFHIFDE